MYLLGHLGIGLGTAWFVSSKARRPIDYRLVLVGAILPDLIDKPLGFLLGLDSRLWAHTFVFFAAVLAASAIPSVRSFVALALGIGTHLVLDRIWDQPWILFWPALGLDFPPDTVNLWNILQILVSDPLVAGGEVVGAIILVLFARAHGIRSWSTLKRFLRDGASQGEPAPLP